MTDINGKPSAPVENAGTVSNDARVRVMSTLHWETVGAFDVLRAELDDNRDLVFGRIVLIKEKYQVEFTAKPDNYDMVMHCPMNDKEAMKRTFWNLVQTGAITGIIEFVRREKAQ